MPEQLTFDLPMRPALGRGDYFVSPSNALAVAQIDAWESWPEGKLVLAGPQGSGKTHLAHVWAGLTGAQIVPASELTEDALPTLSSGPLAVEDAQEVAGSDKERLLFHLHNLMRTARQPLLLTAGRPPSRWGLTLPDLKSRMEGTSVTALEAPDDALISAVLVKQFSDRQIAIAPGVVSYLAARIDRDFAGIARVVDALDRASLARKKPISTRLAAEVLEALDADGP